MPEEAFPLPTGYGWQYHFLVWLQSFHSQLADKLMKGFTLSGIEWFYVFVLPLLFWCVNRKIGLRITYVFLSSMYVNAWIKDALAVVRPIGIPGIRSSLVGTAAGYAMPSAHAQGPMTFWITICKWGKKLWLWPLAFLLIFCIGYSRLYLGLHWPLDILAGWGLGLVFGVIGWGLGRWWTYRAYGYSIRFAMALALPVVLVLLSTGQTSCEYASLLLGIGVGAVFEERYLGLDICPSWWKRICAGVIGMAGLIALQWLVKWPQDQPQVLYLRDVMAGLWATLGAPFVFSLCGLYQKRDV